MTETENERFRNDKTGPSTGDDSISSAEPARDQGATNLLLVLFAAMGCLAGFLGYLVWQSFAEGAPVVLWTVSSPPHDPLSHRYRSGTDPGLFRAEEYPPAEETAKSVSSSVVQRGLRLYRNSGCNLCHGIQGRGGVKNPNYVNKTFPALDQIASRLSVESQEDAEVVIGLLSAGRSLTPEFDSPDAALISAKYDIVTNLILNGNPAMKEDPAGPEPIYMPSFKHRLDKSEMNELLACFLTLYPVEEEEWDDDTDVDTDADSDVDSDAGE